MKTKRPYSIVFPVAIQILTAMSPGCHRCELAGSLRRRRPMVGDIEIVAVPKLACNLFGEEVGDSSLDILLAEWRARGLMRFEKNGPKYKQLEFYSTHKRAAYQVDLFLQPDPATWGVNFMLRTGSEKFSIKMVTAVNEGGYRPNDLRVHGARVWRWNECLPTPEEADVFRLWGMDVVPPEERG